MLLDDFVGKQFESAMGKAMYPSVNKSDLENLDILLPSLEDQETLVKQIETELELVRPAIDIINLFSIKIKEKIKEVWG